MNFAYLVIAIIVSFGLKHALVMMDDKQADINRIVAAVNIFLGIVALANYERWLII
ncbi:hypothetical protein D3C80_849410 [compost metagenome]